MIYWSDPLLFQTRRPQARPVTSMLFSVNLIQRSAVLIAVCAGAIGCSRDEVASSNSAQATGAGVSQAPQGPFNLDGQPFDLWSQGEPAATVLLFTRSNCPISNRFAPEVRRLHELYHPQGVKFFLVYVDPREQPEAIRLHLAQYDYPCPGLRDPEHALVAKCEATTTPEAVVFDRQGAIAYRGRINDLYAALGNPRAEPTTHDLDDAIESTIAGREVAVPRTKAVGCRIADLVF